MWGRCGFTLWIGSRHWRLRKRLLRCLRILFQKPILRTAMVSIITMIRSEQTIQGDTIQGMTERMAAGSLLIPSVVFYPEKAEFNEELQMVNIFRIARYMMRYKDTKIAIVGNTGGTDTRLARHRAEKVRDVLVNKYGIFPNRMEIRTYDVNAKYNVTGYEQSVNFTVTE